MESRNVSAGEPWHRPGPPRRSRRPARSLAACAAIFVGLLAACGEPPPERGAVPTETFVEAMVALRTSPVLGTSGYLPAGEPERILGERGLTPEDLRRFVEAHGANVRMMTDVWTQIESRVAEARGVTEPGS